MLNIPYLINIKLGVKIHMRKALLFGICFFLACSMVIPASLGSNNKCSNKQQLSMDGNGNTLYVGGSGPGNHTNIQDAIDNASDGDTVFVFEGVYFGHILLSKSINLVGEDKNTTFIIGFVAFTISIISDFVNVSGFTIENGERTGEGIRVDSSYNNIINNIIYTPNDNIRISREYNTIKGNNITCDSIILSGDRNIIFDNTIINNFHGIYLTNSCNNIISNNSFFKSGLFISEGTNCNNIVTNNTMNGKPLVYIFNESDLLLDFDTGQIILVNCTEITVQNQKIQNTTAGIILWRSNSCLIINNIISDNIYGIYINGWGNNINYNIISSNIYEGIHLFGDSNNISNNIITNNNNGIYLYFSDNNHFFNNRIMTNNYYGLLLDYGSNFNNFINNTFSNDYEAIRISSDSNSIIDNTITYSGCGIHMLETSNDNIINHNNFINNTQNAIDEGINIWDDGKYGNFYSDYKERYPDAKNKLLKPWIWNIPYKIAGGDNEDTCPLISQWPNPNTKAIIKEIPTIYQDWLKFLDIFSVLMRFFNFINI
jgi:parallel beta-helix repeat protein